MPSGASPWGIWVIVDREADVVVGDIGFFGPPGEDGTVETHRKGDELRWRLTPSRDPDRG
jgi:hypothetical protein